MRYPIVFISGEQGWHTSIPLTDTTWDENGNLLAQRQSYNGEDNGALGERDEDGNALRHRQGGSKRVLQAQYYAFHLQVRDTFSPLLYSGRLLQEFCVDAWVCVEASRAYWPRKNQSQLQIDLYQGVQDTIGTGVEENTQRLGRSRILTSSFTGGPRYMKCHEKH